MVHDECESNLNEDCSKYAHSNINGLNWDKTQECVRGTFADPDEEQWVFGDVPNYMIEAESYLYRNASAINPSMVINNSSYRGQFENQAVMNALCAGFKHPPKVCDSLLGDFMLEDDLEAGIIYV